MSKYSKALRTLSVVALLIGWSGLILTSAAVKAMSHDDTQHLEIVYNPNGPSSYEVARTYENLFEWTRQLLDDRNRFARSFLHTVASASLVAGVVLMLWSMDRERLRHRPSEGDGKRTGRSNGTGASV